MFALCECVSRVIKFDAQEYRSGNKSVVLRNVQRELTAYYKCEVSGDQPTFHTDVKSALMLVVGELDLFDFSNTLDFRRVHSH
jgi:hypothetical protein